MNDGKPQEEEAAAIAPEGEERAENSIPSASPPPRRQGEWLKPYNFQPGTSGNLLGRRLQRKKPFTEALEVELVTSIPDSHPILRTAPHLKGKTWAHAVAYGQILSATKGKADSANLIADRLEGKLTTPLAGYDGKALFPAEGDPLLPEKIVSLLEESGVLGPIYDLPLPAERKGGK